MSAARKTVERNRRATDIEVRVWNVDAARNGHSRWEHGTIPSIRDLGRISPVVTQWERETRSAWRKKIDAALEAAHRNWRSLTIIAFAFILGFSIASGPDSAAKNMALREKLRTATSALHARDGELQLTRLELLRLNSVMDNSTRYKIPSDLAAKIYDTALAEGIDPKVAFSLVNVESEFYHKAVSPVGARGLTQLMPTTARFFDPTLVPADLFDPETNLRIGFRYLKELIATYNGDVDRALHAYNRGPAKVDRIVEAGGDPANGYADAVLKGAAQ